MLVEGVHCVAVRERMYPHVENGEGGLPEVGVDCGYFGKQHPGDKWIGGHRCLQEPRSKARGATMAAPASSQHFSSARVADQELKGQTRVVHSQLEQWLGKRLEETDPKPRSQLCLEVLSALSTPDQGRADRRWRRPQVEFGGNVRFRRVGDQATVRGADLRATVG